MVGGGGLGVAVVVRSARQGDMWPGHAPSSTCPEISLCEGGGKGLSLSFPHVSEVSFFSLSFFYLCRQVYPGCVRKRRFPPVAVSCDGEIAVFLKGNVIDCVTMRGECSRNDWHRSFPPCFPPVPDHADCSCRTVPMPRPHTLPAVCAARAQCPSVREA